jgi:hypothetical protein
MLRAAQAKTGSGAKTTFNTSGKTSFYSMYMLVIFDLLDAFLRTNINRAPSAQRAGDRQKPS